MILKYESILVRNMVPVVEDISMSDQFHIKMKHIAEGVEQMNMVS